MFSLTQKLTTGDGRGLIVADLVQLYRNTFNLSVPKGGKIQKIGEGAYGITARFSVDDCDVLETVNTFKVYSLSAKNHRVESVRCVSDVHDVVEIASATSENGRYLARLKMHPSSSGSESSKKQLLEIWDRSRLIKTVDVSESDYHGPINFDPHFSNFVWSPFEGQDKLLYVCKPKQPKHSSFFKEQSTLIGRPNGSDDVTLKDESPSIPTDSLRGEEFLRKEDWGETLTGIEHTIIGILDVSSNCKITTIDVKGQSLGNPQWLDNGTKIVSVAYQEYPRKLGLIYCNNRPSKLMIHDWQSPQGDAILEIESKEKCFHSPRVNHAGDRFLYLSCSVYGPHERSVKICYYDFRTRVSEVLVDHVTDISQLFIQDLPKRCFTSDDKHIVLVTTDHLFTHMCLYTFEQKRMSKIKFPTTQSTILDFHHDIILASGSEINATPTLFVATLNLLNIEDVVAWHQIEDFIHLDEIEFQSFEIPTADKETFVSAIMIEPNLQVLQKNFPGRFLDANTSLVNEQTQLPTTVNVHGGPHSAYTVRYLPSVVLNARLGFKTLLINYRGSTGVSEDYLKSLNGKVGEMDVRDCLHVIRHLVSAGLINPEKLVIEGGSHGGFLAAHLSSQDEFKFTSAVLRNPVIDLTSLYQTSDIPDWTFNESLGHEHFDFSHLPDRQELVRMFESSPISKYRMVNVPTLMLLGSKDRRVPMFQGQLWVNLIKARGVETLCKVYSDVHGLATAEASTDSKITAMIWILNHLRP